MSRQCIKISPEGSGLLAFRFAWGLEDCDVKGTIPEGFAGASLDDELILMSPAPSSLSQLPSSSSVESQHQYDKSESLK